MEQCITNEVVWVGMDSHKSFISVAVMEGNSTETKEWEIANNPQAVKRLARKLRNLAGDREVRCCYEAGPLGFVLQRQLERSRQGIDCDVIAPSLTPVKPGERVKTDRRDAKKLARNLRTNDLTVVRPPSPEEEAVRDLCRCREDAVRDFIRARQRLNKFFLRRGLHWVKGKRWTIAHYEWVRKQRFEIEEDQTIFEDYLHTVLMAKERVARLDEALDEAAQKEPHRDPVGWLRCFRGIDTVTAMSLVTELHGVERFRSARHLMSYLGMTPSEKTTSKKHRRGSITKAGNAHVRRLLVEAAWAQRHQPIVRVELLRRRRGQPEWVIRQADRALHRLHRKYKRMQSRKVHHNVIVMSVARELAGFIWSVLTKRGAPQTS